jgi:hypothetical protein
MRYTKVQGQTEHRYCQDFEKIIPEAYLIVPMSLKMKIKIASPVNGLTLNAAIIQAQRPLWR